MLKKKGDLFHLKSDTRNLGLSSLRFFGKKVKRFDNLSNEEYDAFVNLIIKKT